MKGTCVCWSVPDIPFPLGGDELVNIFRVKDVKQDSFPVRISGKVCSYYVSTPEGIRLPFGQPTIPSGVRSRNEIKAWAHCAGRRQSETRLIARAQRIHESLKEIVVKAQIAFTAGLAAGFLDSQPVSAEAPLAFGSGFDVQKFFKPFALEDITPANH